MKALPQPHSIVCEHPKDPSGPITFSNFCAKPAKWQTDYYRGDSKCFRAGLAWIYACDDHKDELDIILEIETPKETPEPLAKIGEVWVLTASKIRAKVIQATGSSVVLSINGHESSWMPLYFLKTFAKKDD